jgi:hypothetical protein
MNLIEPGYFKDNIREMKDFYRARLSAEPVAQ